MAATAAARRLTASLLLLSLHAVTAPDADITCQRDGLFVDYDTDCNGYYKCFDGKIVSRHQCNPDRMFSEPDEACVPRHGRPCVRRRCAAGDRRGYAAPGTACRGYYRCTERGVIERRCPSAAWFDAERQSCTFGAGTCFEPLCTGLPDGTYPDSSHECRRETICGGGKMREVRSCAGRCAGTCPPRRTSSVPLPAGDAAVCADDECDSLCRQAADGAHADRATDCREYYVCADHRVVHRGICDPGHVFSAGRCVAATLAACPPPRTSECFGRSDGRHRDWRDCSSWIDCFRERVVERGSCTSGLVFDGAVCVAPERFSCKPARPSSECEARPNGSYMHPASNCSRYFHCEGAMRTELSCGAGQAFDGAACVSAAAAARVCPSSAADSCYGRADGRYPATSSCRAYYQCAGGQRAMYVCPPGRAFDGSQCAPARDGACAHDDRSCQHLPDGYHADVQTGCSEYFYCEGGDKLNTLYCVGGKIFNGNACVSPALYHCGKEDIPQNVTCKQDGFYTHPNSKCRRYYFCISRVRTDLTCPDDKVFNGQVCVNSSSFLCRK